MVLRARAPRGAPRRRRPRADPGLDRARRASPLMRRRLPVDRLRDLSAGRGLTAAEVRARRESYGTNDIAEVAPHPWRDLVRDTARDPMIWFLVGTGVPLRRARRPDRGVTLLVGDRAAGRHGRRPAPAHPRLDRGAREPAGRVGHGVERDGARHRSIPALEIVPGDLALVAAGEPFPADGLVVARRRAADRRVGAHRRGVPGAQARPLTELPSGARGAGGRGRALGLGRHAAADRPRRVRVVFTGGETLYGEIVRSAHARSACAHAAAGGASQPRGVLLVAAAIVVCVILAVVRLRQGYGCGRRAAERARRSRWRRCRRSSRSSSRSSWASASIVWRSGRRWSAAPSRWRTSAGCRASAPTRRARSPRVGLRLDSPPAGRWHLERRLLLALAAIASRRERGDPLDAAILRCGRRRRPPAAGRAGDAFRSPRTAAAKPRSCPRPRRRVLAVDQGRRGDGPRDVRRSPRPTRDTWGARRDRAGRRRAQGHRLRLAADRRRRLGRRRAAIAASLRRAARLRGPGARGRRGGGRAPAARRASARSW